MICIIEENKTSYIPKNLQSYRDSNSRNSILVPNNDFVVIYSNVVRTTRELSRHYNLGFDTSVKRINKTISRPKFINFLYQEDVDKLSAKGLLSQLSDLLKEDKIDSSVLLIFRTVEKWMISQQYYRVDYFLNLVQRTKLNEDAYIAILSSTLPWKNKLSDRNVFYDFSRIELLKEYNSNHNEVNFILSGLK
jgi:hypothetical protein